MQQTQLQNQKAEVQLINAALQQDEKDKKPYLVLQFQVPTREYSFQTQKGEYFNQKLKSLFNQCSKIVAQKLDKPYNPILCIYANTLSKDITPNSLTLENTLNSNTKPYDHKIPGSKSVDHTSWSLKLRLPRYEPDQKEKLKQIQTNF